MLAIAVVVAALVAASDPPVPASQAAAPDAAPAPGRWILSVSAGPAFVGGRVGLGRLSLGDVLGPGAFLGVQALARVTPRLALGVAVEGIADAPVRASAPACTDGAGRGCDASYMTLGPVLRYSFHRSEASEAWASLGTGYEELRLSTFRDPAAGPLLLQGWEVATLGIGYDRAATRRLGVGAFASATAGMFTHVREGPEGATAHGPHWAVRGGVRASYRGGDGEPTALGAAWELAAPRGSDLSVEGRLGGAGCGACGVVLGVAGIGRSGAFRGGAFAEVAGVPLESFPTADRPVRKAGSLFLGAVAGAAVTLGPRLRPGLAGEGGVQLARAMLDFGGDPSAPPPRTASAAVPFVGARASLDLRVGESSAALGVALFVRQPLRERCLDVGRGCDAVGTTIGVVLQGGAAVSRGGDEPAPATPP